MLATDSFLIVVLWSDLFLYLTVASIALLIWFNRQNLSVQTLFSNLGKHGLGIFSLTLFLPYLGIALVDSLHYRQVLPQHESQQQTLYAVEVRSLLDQLLEPMPSIRERTYSQPLAIRTFIGETSADEDANAIRIYPRLKHGGSHLADEAHHHTDLINLGWQTLGYTLVLSLALVLIITGYLRRRHRVPFLQAWRLLYSGQSNFAWRAFIGACVIIFAAVCALMVFNAHYHLLGTDKVGQSILYQVIKSIRTAMIIGLVTTLITIPIAITLGIVAGYFGGWVDDVIQYLYTTLNSIPGVLLIAAATLSVQVIIDVNSSWFETTAERADVKLLALCLILGTTSWTGLCRLLRAETLRLRELEYVTAARAFGVRTHHIMLRHILPNLHHIILIALVMDFSSLVLTEAVLSYIGIGVDPSMHSFGGLINHARMELSSEPIVWWPLLAAFIFMFVLVISANFLADAVRESLDNRAH